MRKRGAHPSLVLALRVAGTTPTVPEHAEPVVDFDEAELSAHRADDYLFCRDQGRWRGSIPLSALEAWNFTRARSTIWRVCAASCPECCR
jgi:hypothetical protein